MRGDLECPHCRTILLHCWGLDGEYVFLERFPKGRPGTHYAVAAVPGAEGRDSRFIAIEKDSPLGKRYAAAVRFGASASPVHRCQEARVG